ncbi:MAG: two-component sensor histidine kinase [Flavobacterium sp.]|nr:MAG: two-component sensor histidine kinase [Flavobacterium sp.] [Flavobacterium sp. FEMGT703F]
MQRIVLTVFCLVFSFGYAQRLNTLYDDKAFTDSLSRVIQTTKNDSIKAFNAFKLADLYRKNKNMSAFRQYLKIGNQFAATSPYLKDSGIYYNALEYAVKNDPNRYAAGMKAALQKLKKYRFEESYNLQTLILQNLSIYYQTHNNPKEALRILTDEAIPLAKKYNNPTVLGNLYSLIGIAIMNNGDRTKANEYFQKAIGEMEKDSPKKAPDVLESKIELYIVAAENLIYRDQLQAAQKLLNKAFSVLKNHPKSNLNGLYYFADGLSYFKQNKFNRAIASYDKGIANCLLNKDMFSLDRLRFVKYQALYALEKYKESNDILIEMVDSGRLLLGDQKNYYKEIALTFEKLGEYKKANEYNQKYIQLNDSLTASNTKEEIALLEAKFNKIENETKIKELKTEKAKADLAIQNNTLKNSLLVLLSMVLLIGITFIFIQIRNKEKLIKEKELKSKQKIDLLKKQKEVEIIQAMLDGEEVERKRIAKELHDGIGSKLSALKIMLSRLDLHESRSKEQINQLISTSINELRQISYNLVPETLLKLGIEKALSDLCYLLHSDTTKIEFQSFGMTNNIPISSQINIYRIIQELINNALKHSDCTEILVSCSQNENMFYIAVEDNGKGFNLEQMESGTGLGLKNIKSRIELLDGSYTIDSNETGTAYNIELKIKA